MQLRSTTRLNVVWDTYLPDSLKECTRAKRGKGCQEPARRLSYLQHLGVESLSRGGKGTASVLPIAPAPAQAQTTAGSKTIRSANTEPTTSIDQGATACPMETECGGKCQDKQSYPACGWISFVTLRIKKNYLHS